MAVVVVGITGHRFLMETGRIEAGLDQAFERLAALHPGAEWRGMSSIAQGADCLFAERLLTLPGAQLWVPLPLPEDEYIKDFTTPQAAQQFTRLLGQAQRIIRLPVAKSRKAAYLAAGRAVLDASGVLFAVWDGAPAQGTGGTGGIVAQARQRGMPLAWIHAGNRKPGSTTPTTLGAQQGTVSYENFPQEANDP